MTVTPLPPGMTIGILGGGQLGRMLATAAAKLGFTCHIYCPERRSPAFAVAAARTVAAYDDQAALRAFAESVDVVTLEFENIPAATVQALAARVPVRPGVRSLTIAQDRLAEKQLMLDLGIKVPSFAPVNTLPDIYSALARTGRPARLKTRRLGYDGKGQSLIRQGDDPSNAWRAVGEAPSLLESHVAFEREISVVLARTADGATQAFDIAENQHKSGILRETRVPASLTPALADRAHDYAIKIADSLDHVGVLAVEMFVMDGSQPDTLMVNEFAPRVHNSGHYTADACRTSQFEQHIRAVAGWPLGDSSRHSDAVMVNLIGDDVAAWHDFASSPGASLTLYGKAETRPGRKMGHVTQTAPMKSTD
ncbi:MAG: 5-(carboxyamino)imidazole ribonucleotide synthase [Alphaproteobacteria bacterium]